MFLTRWKWRNGEGGEGGLEGGREGEGNEKEIQWVYRTSVLVPEIEMKNRQDFCSSGGRNRDDMGQMREAMSNNATSLSTLDIYMLVTIDRSSWNSLTHPYLRLTPTSLVSFHRHHLLPQHHPSPALHCPTRPCTWTLAGSSLLPPLLPFLLPTASSHSSPARTQSIWKHCRRTLGKKPLCGLCAPSLATRKGGEGRWDCPHRAARGGHAGGPMNGPKAVTATLSREEE